MKHVLRVVNVVATLVIVGALVVILRAMFTGSGEVPTLFGYSFYRALTGSMEPEIPTKSLVVVQECDVDELQVGDVITFRATDPGLEGALNTHRIVAVYDDEATGERMFRTKGDANAVEDAAPVEAVNVVGKVVAVSAGLGFVASLIANPLVFFPLVVVPLAILMALEVVRAVRAARAVARAEDEEALRAAVRQLRSERASGGAENADPTPGSASSAPVPTPIDPKL